MTTKTVETKTATVLAPETVEIDGRVYTPAGPAEERERLRAAAWRLVGEFGLRLRAGGDPALRTLWGQLRLAEGEREAAATTELLRFVGKSLIDDRRLDAWKLLYLELRRTDVAHASSRMLEAILEEAERAGDRTRCAEYRDGDECLFALGPGWRSYLDEDEDEGEPVPAAAQRGREEGA